MERAELIELAQNNGIIVDKRWNTVTLLAALRDNGVTVPDDNPALEGDDPPESCELEGDEVAAPVAATPKKSDGCVAICLDDHIYIAPKDVGKYDNGLSVIYRKGDKIPFLNKGVAQSLDAAGRVKLV